LKQNIAYYISMLQDTKRKRMRQRGVGNCSNSRCPQFVVENIIWFTKTLRNDWGHRELQSVDSKKNRFYREQHQNNYFFFI